jgi:hypothetical protein
MFPFHQLQQFLHHHIECLAACLAAFIPDAHTLLIVYKQHFR